MKQQDDMRELIINDLTELSPESVASMTLKEGELYLINDEVDTTPTQGSTNSITSGAVYDALKKKANRTMMTYTDIHPDAWVEDTSYPKYNYSWTWSGMTIHDHMFIISGLSEAATPEEEEECGKCGVQCKELNKTSKYAKFYAKQKPTTHIHIYVGFVS